MDLLQEYSELKKTIDYHMDRYYNQDEPEISDYEYDKLMIRLKEIEKEHPEWVKCIDAMLAKLSFVLRHFDSLDDSPNAVSITNALKWLQFLRVKFPYIPPTCIVPEPGGGIIIQRRAVTFGRESIFEFTLYNNGTGEYCRYEEGKVVDLKDIPSIPDPEKVVVL